MSDRLGTIVLTVAMLLQLLLGAGSGTRLLCLGGTQGQVAVSAFESADASACDHAEFMPNSTSEGDPHDCECIDVELADFKSDLIACPESVGPQIAVPSPFDASPLYLLECTDSRVSRAEPPWFDPRLERHLTLVTSTRLTI